MMKSRTTTMTMMVCSKKENLKSTFTLITFPDDDESDTNAIISDDSTKDEDDEDIRVPSLTESLGLIA